MNPWRPPKYDDSKDYVSIADEYLTTCSTEQMKLPKLEEFCEIIGIDEGTVSEWNKLYPNSNFTEACKKIMRRQKSTVIDGGFFGGKEVNSAMAIFLLKANHGMIETEKKMLVGEDGKSLTGLITINESNKSESVADGSKKR